MFALFSIAASFAFCAASISAIAPAFSNPRIPFAFAAPTKSAVFVVSLLISSLALSAASFVVAFAASLSVMFALFSIAASFAFFVASISTIAPTLLSARSPASLAFSTFSAVSVSVLLILVLASSALSVTIVLKPFISSGVNTFCLVFINSFCLSASAVIAFNAPVLFTSGAGAVTVTSEL